jgi:metal-responsive CopG/Arc/MetJ family transcriptional regulator
MRTLVDIPEPQLSSLTAISKARKVSRAEVIREAIATYIEIQPNPARDAAFGIWKGGEDGLEYQRRIRDEW